MSSEVFLIRQAKPYFSSLKITNTLDVLRRLRQESIDKENTLIR